MGLFDLKADPQELYNCYHDAGYQDTVRMMTDLLDKKMDEIGDISALGEAFNFARLRLVCL